MDSFEIFDRQTSLFSGDLQLNSGAIREAITGSKIMIIGGAGTIGQATAKAIFAHEPSALHIVDLSENNLVETVRDLRSSFENQVTDLRTFAIDAGSVEFEFLIDAFGGYDYMLNLSALKHVRSEKDPFTLYRMLTVNIFNSVKFTDLCARYGIRNFFCVSTDKASDPVNLMGASKRIMELGVSNRQPNVDPVFARFANVAFSDGSLPFGFNNRLTKMQPLSAPLDVKRYFISKQEAGELCMLASTLGVRSDIFFPKDDATLKAVSFSDLAILFLQHQGYEPVICETETEARSKVPELAASKKWPCYFFQSDTTGEKYLEEFFTKDEILDLDRFQNVGVIKKNLSQISLDLDNFIEAVELWRAKKNFDKRELVDIIQSFLPNLNHEEKGKYLDERM